MKKLYTFDNDQRTKSESNLKDLLQDKKIWINYHHRTKSYRWAYQLFLVHQNRIINCTRMVMIIMNGKIINEKYLYGTPDSMIESLSFTLFGKHSEIEIWTL